MIDDYAKTYEIIYSFIPEEMRELAWAHMTYVCSDSSRAPQQPPPDFDRIYDDPRAKEHGWVKPVLDENGMIPGTPAGCGYERIVYVCVGVEGPKDMTCIHKDYPHEGPCVLSFAGRKLGLHAGETLGGDFGEKGHGLYIPSPFVAGRCPNCTLPLSHTRFQDDQEFWPPMPVPRGHAYFRFPSPDKWGVQPWNNYGGAELVEPLERVVH